MEKAKSVLLRFSTAALLAASSLSCGGTNYFAPMSDKDSDEAVLEAIKKLANEQDWDGAIARLSDLSTEFRSGTEATRTEASVYAGKCGLNMLDFVENLGGSGAPFLTFMTGFQGTAVSPAACQTAQEAIERLGVTAAARTSSLGSTVGSQVNMFMAILGMVKIGAQLRAKADVDGAGGLGDGSTDAGFDACSASGDISDAEIAQVGTGFALVLDNFSTIAATLGSAGDVIDDLQDDCAMINPNPCIITDPDDSDWTDPVVQEAFRALVKSNTLGIQGCANANPFTCCP